MKIILLQPVHVKIGEGLLCQLESAYQYMCQMRTFVTADHFLFEGCVL